MMLSNLQNQLSKEEIRIIQELRKVEWGKVTIVKKNGVITLITPAPDKGDGAIENN